MGLRSDMPSTGGSFPTVDATWRHSEWASRVGRGGGTRCRSIWSRGWRCCPGAARLRLALALPSVPLPVAARAHRVRHVSTMYRPQPGRGMVTTGPQGRWLHPARLRRLRRRITPCGAHGGPPRSIPDPSHGSAGISTPGVQPFACQAAAPLSRPVIRSTRSARSRDESIGMGLSICAITRPRSVAHNNSPTTTS